MDTKPTIQSQVNAIDQAIDNLLELRNRLTNGETKGIPLIIYSTDDDTNGATGTVVGSGRNLSSLLYSCMKQDEDIAELFKMSVMAYAEDRLEAELRGLKGELGL